MKTKDAAIREMQSTRDLLRHILERCPWGKNREFFVVVDGTDRVESDCSVAGILGRFESETEARHFLESIQGVFDQLPTRLTVSLWQRLTQSHNVINFNRWREGCNETIN